MTRLVVWLTVIVVLIGLGYVTMDRGAMREKALLAERSPPRAPVVAAPVAALPAAPIAAPPEAPVAAPALPVTAVVDPAALAAAGYGLSFAISKEPTPSAAVVHLNCHGEPASLDRPHRGSCNPYAGDTSCRSKLPIACYKATGARAPGNPQQGSYDGWTHGQLAATQPVLGATMSSEAVASAHCETELGQGWRMAEFHDGGGGWRVQGERGAGIQSHTRYWVHINDQRGNCWNSAR